MNKNQPNFDEFKFICSKAQWYLSQNPKDLQRYFQQHKIDSLYFIQHKKRGLIFYGREASERFYNIAERYLNSRKDEKAKTNLNEFIDEIKKEFTRRFIDLGEDVTDRNMNRMINTAYKKMSRKFEHLTHYIPCEIFVSKSIDEFTVGPIKFLHKRIFEASFKDEIEHLRELIKEQHQERCAQAVAEGYPSSIIATETQSQELANSLVDGLNSSFQNYEWIGVVSIPECDENVSYDKAFFAIKTALNILKLLIGGQHTDQVRTGKDPGDVIRFAKLTRKNDGKLDISLSFGSGGNVVGDKWLDILNTEAAHYFHLATKLLGIWLSSNTPPPLCVRYIDALSWYGDAVSERAQAAKIIKFVSSIERLTGTGIEGERRVTEIVTNRASILYSIATGEPLTESREKVSRIYNCRSDLVHGSLSPFDRSCISYARRAGEISRMVLLIGLDYFFSLGIEDTSNNLKQLKLKYKELESKYKKVE